MITRSANPPPLEQLFAGDSEMARRMRGFDWSKTAIGPPEAWSPTLHTLLPFLLANRFPCLLWWGPEYIQLYNDAYIPVLGKKHPYPGLGMPVRECWNEIWHILQPLIDTPFHGGEATWIEDLELEIFRHGFMEETHFTVAYSPVPDTMAPGGIGGVLATVHETTKQVIQERRVRMLQGLSTHMLGSQTSEDVAGAACRAFAETPKDIPFAAVYLFDEGGATSRLAGTSGASPGDPCAPVQLPNRAGGVWPIAEVVARRHPVVVTDVASRCAPVPPGPWSDPPSRAIVLPIPSPPGEPCAGIIVFGVSARAALDELYRGFFELAAVQVAAAISNARGYEAERKRAESLAELDRAKTAFFSNVSHEFRTPLTLMLGNLEDVLSEDHETLEEPVRERLGVAYRNSLRLLRLVNALLDFARIEAGRARATLEATDLARLTADLASNFTSTLERAGLTFRIDCPPLSRPVHVDRDMWEKVVLNLISNAFKFTLEGEIQLVLSERGDGVELLVRDTGCGIPEHELQRVFDRFHRVEGTRGRTFEGTGIGLALASELVRAHGGTMSVESVLGAGSTFRVSVPWGDARAMTAERPSPPERASLTHSASLFVEEARGWLPAGDAPLSDPALATSPPDGRSLPRILVADDNADMRTYVTRLLSGQFHVEAVSDGEEALHVASERPPDLILSDVMMPGLDGFGLLRRLRDDARTASIPVILLSARAGEESRIEGHEAWADDYLVKPFSARELVARVSSTLGLARARREAAEERTHLAERLALTAVDANRVKDEFLAVLSHELRTPMNAMLGWIQILKSTGARDPALVDKAVTTLERNIGVQAQVINDLLDVSRILSGKLQIESDRLELGAIVLGTVESLRPSAEAKSVALRLEVHDQELDIIGDKARLHQIAGNIIGNAIKFTDAGGSVTVSLDRDPEGVRLVVSDSGQGIPPELLPHIFERFRQADGSSVRRHGGLGLGLSIVKSLVECHGGTVHATSDGLERGARFEVRLPPAPARQRLTFTSGTFQLPAYVAPAEGLDVLVIEDDADTREALEVLLRAQGLTIRSARSVREALDAFDRKRPDVILSDIAMPDEDGYAFIRAIREREGDADARALAVAITGFAGRQDHAMALRSGFDAHIPKPIDPALLVERIRALAASRATGSDSESSAPR